MERNLTYEWDSEVFAYFFASAFSEQIDLLFAIWALEVAHIFNNPDNWHVELVEHAYRLDCNIHCYVLGCSDDENTSDGYRLGDCQRSVPGTRWQVNYQVIKLTPGHVCQELLDDARNDWAPVNAGLLRLLVEKAMEITLTPPTSGGWIL